MPLLQVKDARFLLCSADPRPDDPMLIDWKSLRQRIERALPGIRARADEHVEAGNERFRRGDVEGALEEYEAALAIEPGCARAHFNIGVVMQDLKRPDDAIRHYAAAAEADPSSSKALVNWGNVLKDRGSFEAAYDLYRRALATDPNDAKALVNCGTVRIGIGDLEGAAELYRKALEIEGGNPDALGNLASIAQQHGDFAEAERLYAQAAKAEHGFADAQYNLGLIALHRTDFERGWKDYELRFRTDPPASTLRPLPLPMAGPDDLAGGKRIAIRKEQGIGDQILFSTLLPELAARHIDALVEIDARLVEAYRRSVPGLEFTTPDELRSDPRGCALQFPVGSLPLAYRRKLEDFRRQPMALLRPDARRVDEIRSRLGSGRRIGISWRSFQAKKRKHIEERKSAPLECFAALEGRGVTLVDLQYGDAAAEREAFDARHPGLRASVPGLDLFKDLEGVLAAIDLCELVVTTSNVTAHLAGAIGKRTYLVFLGAVPPFPYWVRGPEGRSLWYPSVEIVNDPAWLDWDRAFAAIAQRRSSER